MGSFPETLIDTFFKIKEKKSCLTSWQNCSFSYRVAAKALTRFSWVHFLQLFKELTRNGMRTFSVSWLREIC